MVLLCVAFFISTIKGLTVKVIAAESHSLQRFQSQCLTSGFGFQGKFPPEVI